MWFIYCSKLISVRLSVSSEISVLTLLPTQEPVGSFNIYLIKLLLVPNVLWLLVLKKSQRTLKAVTHILNYFNWHISRKSYWFSLQPHVNEVHLVFAVPLARVGGRVLWVWGALWCHVHPPSTQNHLKRTPDRIIIFTVMILILKTYPALTQEHCGFHWIVHFFI